MVVADAVGDLEVVRRIERDALVASRDSNRANNLQILTWRRQCLHTSFLNQIDEWRRTAVHDWHFRRIELDQHVVDVHADKGCQEVLNGLDSHVVTCQSGGELNAGEMLDGGW